MGYVYEAFFFLKYSGGWSFAEAYNLPVGLRTWFVERLITQLKNEAEAMKSSSSSSGASTLLTPHNNPQRSPQNT
jgi:hypothetical protein